MEAYQRLEREWAEFNGLDPAGMVVCSSGTAALHLALEALRLPLGSEVICSDFNMVAVPRAVTLAGLTPVFVDCDDRLLLDPAVLKTVMNRDTLRAVVVTHVYGRRADMDRIHAICDELDLLVVEDLAEAHGVRPHPKTDAACWSFYRNKIVAGEEGGAVAFLPGPHTLGGTGSGGKVTGRWQDDVGLARSLRTLGFTAAHDYTHVPRGHNYRLANCLAELILESLQAYTIGNISHTGLTGRTPEQRREIEAWYEAACPPDWKMPSRDAAWVYDVRVPGLTTHGLDRVVTALKAAGVQARHAFKPMSRLEEFRHCDRQARADRAGTTVGTVRSSRTGWGPQETEADRAAREVFYLPVEPGRTTEADCRRAFAVLRAAVGGAE